MARKILLVANTDWYLFNFRLSLAHTLRNQGWEPVLVSPSGPFATELESSGFRWLPVSIDRRGILPHTELQTLRGLRTIYREEIPDLIHHHTVKPVLYGTLAARSSGIRAIVNSITGLGYVFLSRGITARVLRLLLKPAYRFALADRRVHVIFENRGDRKFFIDRGLVQSDQQTLIEGVGVDLDRYRPVEEVPGVPLVIMASRMLWDKGVQEFVEAATLLRRKGTEARFALVGAPDLGNPASIPVGQIEGWAERGHVEWWGYRRHMPSVYDASHIVTLPSHFEGLPTVLLEAAASGRALVATDIPGNREVVIDGKNGLLVPVGDAIALSKALERLISNTALRREMGMKGRELVERRFGQDKINARTIAVYEDALEKMGSASQLPDR